MKEQNIELWKLLWRDATLVRPENGELCVCYDTECKSTRCYEYDHETRCWRTYYEEERRFVCDYSEYRVSYWIPMPIYSGEALVADWAKPITSTTDGTRASKALARLIAIIADEYGGVSAENVWEIVWDADTQEFKPVYQPKTSASPLKFSTEARASRFLRRELNVELLNEYLMLCSTSQKS